MSEHAHERLTAFLHAELATPEVRDLKAHLDACAQCAADLQSLRRAHELMSAAVRTVPPDSVWQRIQIELHPPAAASRRNFGRQVRRVSIPALAVAATLVVLFLPRGSD